jgi:protease-4
VPFFIEIARFALKGLIVVAIFFLATLAVIAAFAVGGGAGGGDLVEDAGSRADGFADVVRGELNDDEDNKLAIVPVSGLIDSLSISEANPADWFSNDFVTYGYTIKETLADLAADETIKGVLLLMNTPGGTINGSKAIADGVRAYQEATGQPVYAYVQSISASGGMWSMAGADHIIADEGALVGSIGVILGSLLYYDDPIAVDQGLLFGGVETRGGIKATTLAAGDGKDFGNPYRQASEQELAAIQANLEDLYDLFRAHVAEERGLTDEQVRDLGAMVYSPRRAQAFGLVDEVADFDAALASLAEKAGLGGDFAAVQQTFVSGAWFEGLVQSFIPGAPTVVEPAPVPGVAVCQRAEPLVLSDFYARQYPGC